MGHFVKTHSEIHFQPEPHEFRCQLASAGGKEVLGAKLLGPSYVWQSVTPFLGNADIGSRGQSRFLRKGLRREWRRLAEHVEEYHGVELLDVDELAPDDIHAEGMPQPREFLRARRKDGGRQAYRPAAIYRLRFSREVAGPFSLGYACHFGMGRFGPAE
jgi:CRISPR-associated protein Csb2